jgi:hypothetical protein
MSSGLVNGGIAVSRASFDAQRPSQSQASCTPLFGFRYASTLRQISLPLSDFKLSTRIRKPDQNEAHRRCHHGAFLCCKINMSLLYHPVLSNEANGRSLSSSSSSSSSIPSDIAGPSRSLPSQQWQHLYVLPVLLLEFLAIALTRAVIPALLLHKFGNRVYLIMGMAEFIRGLLAFVACPLFGKVSDIIGRRLCLFVTVLGTCKIYPMKYQTPS